MEKRGISIDALALIIGFIIVAQLLSYVVPQGQFQREPFPDNPDRSMVVAGSYTPVAEADTVSMPPWQFLLSISEGMADAQAIIFLIFIVGGVIQILRASGAIDAALHRAVAGLGHSPWILIAGCFALFGLGSFTIGMGEEYLPLVPILVTMCLAMRMDALVAMGMVWVPYAIGWACAGINPFGVMIAQSIAGVPLASGWGWKLAMMVAFGLLGFHHVYRYARQLQRDPASSLVAHVDYSDGFEVPQDVQFDAARVAIVAVFLLGIAGFVYGAANHHWYITELNAVFLGIGFITALLARMSVAATSRNFIEGAAAMAGPALIVGFARTIAIVLEQGQVIDTIVHAIAGLLEGMPAAVSAVGMLLIQTLFNFFMPSGSGQAFVTMPIMSPLATLTGVPQQTAVLAYQFGDGFTNMIIPTNALVMGALALGRIPYGAWVRFLWPLLLKIFVLAVVCLVLSVYLLQ